MARRRRGRAIDGIVLLDKPLGISSNRLLQRVRGVYQAQKAGHTGNLDPLASGVLPICLGEATKFSQFLLDADKCYEFTAQFGKLTTTGDSEGEVLQTCDASGVEESHVIAAAQQFVGLIEQVPPMYSALKHNGRPLYELARQGIEVERKSRAVTILKLELLAFRPGPEAEADFAVTCTKGTYVRTLAEDIGEVLKVGAYVTALRRTTSSGFELVGCHLFEDLQALADKNDLEGLDNLLLPVDTALKSLPKVELDDECGYYLRRGQPVRVKDSPNSGLVRLNLCSGEFLGMGEISDDGRIQPRRLIASETCL